MIERLRTGRAAAIGQRTLNRLADTDQLVRQLQRHGALSRSTASRDRDIILVRNDSGADRTRFEVLGIGGPVIRPTDNPALFYGSRMALKGVVPTAAHLDKFVVLLAPLAQNAIGRAYASGVFPTLVDMADESHEFADVNASSAGFLRSAASGAAQLLYVEPIAERYDPGKPRCIVRIGGGGIGGTQFALITSRAGSEPPYRYAAEAAAMDADGTWSAVVGGQVYNNVFNLEEQGDGGQWVNPLLVGDVIAVFPAPGGADAWVCSRSHYRGTY